MNSSYRAKNHFLSRLLIAYIPLSLLTPVMMYQLRDNNRLIVIDGRNSYHVTAYADHERLLQLYDYTARLACEAFLMRNPTGLDRPRLFDEMFTGKARESALEQIKAEMMSFYSDEIHQKVEILKIKVLEADSRTSFVQVSGQLIRSFRKETATGTSAVKFEMSLNLAVNYDLGKNAVYPFVVTGIQFSQTEKL